MKVDQYYFENFTFSQDDVDKFSEISGDKNPIHIDDEYAKKTIFNKRIIHGFLSGSIFSKIIGTSFPGEGSIYLKQELKFLKPMYVNILYKATITIKEIQENKKRLLLETIVVDLNTNEETIIGFALVYYPNL